MNKFFTLLLAFSLAATLNINAADTKADYTTSKSKVVSVNPISLTYGRINASLETKMGADNSFTVTAGYWDLGWGDWYALNIGASYKWYLDLFEEGKKSLNGLALGPRADFYQNSYSGTYRDYDSYSTFTIGAEVSYKWVFGEGKWAIEPNLSFAFPVTKKRYGFAWQGHGWGVNVGYCF